MKSPNVILTCMALAAGALLPGSAAAQRARRSPAEHAQAYAALAAAFPRARSATLPDKCGLPVLSAALRARRTLTQLQSAALTTLTIRPGGFQDSIMTPDGRFMFHFDTTGTDAPALLDSAWNRIAGTARAFVDSAVTIISEVYFEEVGVLGFLPPPSDGSLGGNSAYDIYILNLGPSLYGETFTDNDVASGGTSTTFMEIHNDFSFVTPNSNRGIPALKVTLAHEFHHAIQIGSYGYWYDNLWFHEITSVWMEDVVFHGVNDYLNYLFDPSGQFMNPGEPLTANDFIVYSRGILGKYLTKRFGRDTMLHIWENARTAGPLGAFNVTLQALASSLGIAFAEWVEWNYFTGRRADTANFYSEGRLFPVMAETYYDLISPSQQVSNSLFCLSSGYYGYATGVDTLTVALANIDAACPSSGQSTSPFVLTVGKTNPDGTYRAVPGGLFMKLDAANPSLWVPWAITAAGGSASSAGEGSAYPDPFLTARTPQVYFPAEADGGTLSIYSTGMELVYSASLLTQTRLGQRVFAWNGMTASSRPAPSGVYIFVLSLPGRTVRGKLALVRQ